MYEITVYTTPTCSYCNDVKDFLDSYNLTYQIKDVSKDEKALSEILEISDRRSVPLTVINSQVVLGWEEEKLMKVLKEEGVFMEKKPAEPEKK